MIVISSPTTTTTTTATTTTNHNNSNDHIDDIIMIMMLIIKLLKDFDAFRQWGATVHLDDPDLLDPWARNVRMMYYSTM